MLKATDLRTYGESRALRSPCCDYASNVDIHVTLCADRGEPFGDGGVASIVCRNVEFYCRKMEFTLYGYCLMPDHLHVLLSPGESGTALSRWLDSFKSYTTHEFMKTGGLAPLWQRSAHDHVCRTGETAERVMSYVANNPVRAGLVPKWDAWPWTRVFVQG